MEQNENGTIEKKELERKDLAEAPCSIERNGKISKKSERAQS